MARRALDESICNVTVQMVRRSQKSQKGNRQQMTRGPQRGHRQGNSLQMSPYAR
jgi:hypothetical protein